MHLTLRKLLDNDFSFLYVLVANGKRVDSFIYKSAALRHAALHYPGVFVEREKLLDGMPRWPRSTRVPTRLPESERALGERHVPRSA